jgi:hypothetical protein
MTVTKSVFLGFAQFVNMYFEFCELKCGTRRALLICGQWQHGNPLKLGMSMYNFTNKLCPLTCIFSSNWEKMMDAHETETVFCGEIRGPQI